MDIHVAAGELVGWRSICNMMPHRPVNNEKKHPINNHSFGLCQFAAMASTDEPLDDPGTLLKNLSYEGQHLGIIELSLGKSLFRIYQLEHRDYKIGTQVVGWSDVGSIFQSHIPSSNTISGNFANPWRSSCQKP